MKAGFLIAALAATLTLQSCFTGIESTPRITDGDVRRQAAAKPTPEMLFLANITSETPASWRSGKRFRVTDNRLERLFAYTDGRADSLAGTDILYIGIDNAPSLTGEGAAIMTFTTCRGDSLRYRIDDTPASIMKRQRLEIPFTVELKPVEQADSLMRGNAYYINTPLWRRTDGRSRPGFRHVPVRIVRVDPGSDGIYPAAVVFTPVDTPTDTAMVMMSLGGERAPRNFASLFSFANPREAYPHITDEVWQLIINSQVQINMTRDECRLALGAPGRIEQIPTTAGIIERWSYGDGIYLIFEDGMLTSYRL